MLRILLVLFLTAFASAAPAQTVVGSKLFQIADDSRADPATGDMRAWQVELFYPAMRGETPREIYFPDKTFAEALAESGYYDVPAAQVRGWAGAAGPAHPGAAAATQEALPLIIMLPGQGVARRNYSELASAFARAGYVVALTDLPYLGVSRLPDGRMMSPDDLEDLRAGEPDAMAPLIAEWAQDVSATLDFLEKAREGDNWPAGLSYDSARIAAVGHSLGGTVSLDVCGAEARVSACVNLEGAPFGAEAAETGVGGPTLVVLSRAEDKPASLTEGIPADLAGMLGRAGAPVWLAAVSGGGHMSFSDAPARMPETLSRFGGGLMSPQRSKTVYIALVSGFLDAYLGKADAQERFTDAVDALPEVKTLSADAILRAAPTPDEG